MLKYGQIKVNQLKLIKVNVVQENMLILSETLILYLHCSLLFLWVFFVPLYH